MNKLNESHYLNLMNPLFEIKLVILILFACFLCGSALQSCHSKNKGILNESTIKMCQKNRAVGGSLCLYPM